MSDQELWARVCAGDGSAFTELYRHRSGRVMTHLHQRLASWHDAEDLTAEVFSIAWRQRATVRIVDGEAGILPWLLVTANHLVANRRRSLFRAHRALGRYGGGVVDEPDIAEAVVASDAERRAVELARDLLAGLRPGDRDIIQLLVFQRLTAQQVADATGTPVGTIRSRLSRALSRLRRLHGAHTVAVPAEVRGQ